MKEVPIKSQYLHDCNWIWTCLPSAEVRLTCRSCMRWSYSLSAECQTATHWRLSNETFHPVILIRLDCIKMLSQFMNFNHVHSKGSQPHFRSFSHFQLCRRFTSALDTCRKCSSLPHMWILLTHADVSEHRLKIQGDYSSQTLEGVMMGIKLNAKNVKVESS